MHRKIFTFALIIFFTAGLSTVKAEPVQDTSSQNMTLVAVQLNEVGFELIKDGKHAEAEKYILDAIKLDPSVKFYYNNLAVIYIHQKKYKEASQQLDIALSIDPNYVKALSNQSIVSFYRYRFKEAYSFYQQAQKADKAYADARFERTRVTAKVAELQQSDPDNQDLKAIMEYLNKENKNN